MELDVRLGITSDDGDITFVSTETEDLFIIASHLPGYKNDSIEVAINEGGKQISIRGGGHIACQAAVITNRVAITQDVSLACFEKTFRVLDCVDWGGVDAWFDEDEEMLIISIPKLLVNECTSMGEEETAEHPVREEGQVCKEENESIKEFDDILRRRSETKNEKPEVQMPDKKPEAELIEPEDETREAPGKQDNEIKLAGRESSEKQEIEHHETSEEEEHKPSKKRHMEKLSQQIKEAVKQPKSEKQEAEGEKHHSGEGLQKYNYFSEEQPYEKPKTGKLPEHEKPPQKDAKPRLETPDQAMDAKHPAISFEAEEKIQKQENGKDHDKVATEQKCEKLKAGDLPDKQLKQGLNVYKEDEDRKMKVPEIEASTKGESLKSKELPQDLRKQKKEKPTLKAPKEMLESGEAIKAGKEVEPELQQQEQEAQEQNILKGLSQYKDRIIKFQEPKEPGQNNDETLVSTPEEVMEAAQHQSKIDGGITQYEKNVQEDKEPIIEPASEKPRDAEFQQKEEQRAKVHEFQEDEDPQRMVPDREAPKTRMSQDLDEKYNDLLQEEDVMKHKVDKPTDKGQQEVAEHIKPKGEKGSKQKLEQLEEQPTQEQRKTMQIHEKLEVKTPDQLQENTRQIESKDIKKESQRHKDKVLEDQMFTVAPEYQKPEDTVLEKKDELKPTPHLHNKDEDNQWKKSDIENPKIREPQHLNHKEQVRNKPKPIKPSIKAPKKILTDEEHTRAEEEIMPYQQPEVQEHTECEESTIHPPYEKHDTTQLEEPIEADQKHKREVRKLIQKVQETAQVQSEPYEKELHEREHKKPQVALPIHVVEDKYFQTEQLKKEILQNDLEMHERDEPNVEPTCEKPKFAEHTRTRDPKPRLYGVQDEKSHQWVDPKLEAFPTKKTVKLDEESQLSQQEKEIIKQKTVKAIEKTRKELQRTAEPMQAEKGKEVEKEQGQCKEEAQREKMHRMPSYQNEIEQNFQISAKTEEEIQKQQNKEQECEKPATAKKYEKSKADEFPDKEPNQRFDEFKEDEHQQLKGPNIEESKTREPLKLKELSQDLKKQMTEKKTKKLSKEMLEEFTENKNQDIDQGQQQEKKKEVQEPKMPKGLVYEKARAVKFREPKEPGQNNEKTLLSALEKVMEVAQHIQSKQNQGLKQKDQDAKQDLDCKKYEQEVQKEKESIIKLTRGKSKDIEFPQKDEQKIQFPVFQKYENHGRVAHDGEASKIKMPLKLEGKYKDLQQGDELMKQKTEKLTEEAHKEQENAEHKEPKRGKETKTDLIQTEQQEKQECTKPHEEETSIISPIAEIDNFTKATKLRRRRHFHCRCGSRCPDFPIPPSTLFSGSALVFSIIVFGFHFIKRKNLN